MTVHFIRTDSRAYHDTLSGRKGFEVCRDTDLNRGDIVGLRETHHDRLTGRLLLTEINHILRHQDNPLIPEGIAVIGIDIIRDPFTIPEWNDIRQEADRLGIPLEEEIVQGHDTESYQEVTG